MEGSGKNENFSAMVGDVVPLQQSRVQHKAARADKPNLAQQAARLSAIECLETRQGFSSSGVQQVKPLDIVGFKREGVQDGVFKKLRLGRYEAQASLDLHNMTLAQAEQEVADFAQACLSYELRTVIIIHGRGERDPESPARMKSHVLHWLPQLDGVMAFRSAPKDSGGSGALYILLRKHAGAN